MCSNYPTIVTMFYDIRKKEQNDKHNTSENSNILDNRQKNKYIELSKKFILTLPYPLIVFIDEDSQEIVDIINEERKNLTEKTQIFQINLENTYYYKHIDRVDELQKQFQIYNADLNHETPLYIILNNNKFFFMEKAVTENPFNSTHFIWCDFGINHVALDYEKIHEWILFVPDKVKQLCINPYIEEPNHKEVFHYVYHHTAGGLFSGSCENILKYCDLFKNTTEKMYRENWYQIDEAIMTIVQRENPELFDLYYGDYQGIISNYLTPVNNIWLIIKGIEKAINHNYKNLAYTMLNYCHSYFYNNLNDSHIYRYICSRLIIDYYSNNGKLHNGVIFVINKKLLEKDEQMISTLINNIEKINYYSNKQLLLLQL